MSPLQIRTGLLSLLQELDGRPRQELQATLHRTDLQIGTALRAVPELQVFHFDRLPGFKGGFLFRVGFTPLLFDMDIFPWGGISLGYTF